MILIMFSTTRRYCKNLLVGFIIYVILFSYNDIFGYQNDTLIWKLIAVSTFDDCGTSQWNIIHNYVFIIKEYLSYYKIDNRFNPPLCVSTNNFEKELAKAKSTNDLIIVMPDYLESLRQQIKLNEYGHFALYENDYALIVSQVLIKNQIDEKTVWTLSHELSHFALHWYGYPENVVRDKVHEADFLHALCLTEKSGAICQKLIIPIDVKQANTQFSAMSPFYVLSDSGILENGSDLAEEKINQMLTNKAKLWSDNKMSDYDFMTSVMLDKESKIQSNLVNASPDEAFVPHWFKKNAKWWANNQISTQDFFYCLQFLMQENIIRYG